MAQPLLTGVAAQPLGRIVGEQAHRMTALNQQQTAFDVIVVGGGMTGSALALGLVAQGWQVALVEAAPVASLRAPLTPASSVHDIEPRVSAISPASERLLTSVGAWQGVLEDRHCAYTAMDVWDADGTGRICFDAREMGAPALGTIVENRSLVRALFDALADSPVTVFDDARVDGLSLSPGKTTVALSGGPRLNAALVVAADGAQSRLRHLAGLPTREWDYNQQAVVCTVATEHSHRNTAWQRFTETGPLAFLPLKVTGDAEGARPDGDNVCSIVWSQDTPEARRLMALSDEAFRHQLAAALEFRLGEVTHVSGRTIFPLRQRHAKDYVKAGFALIGDAAHTIHPLAGQGANLGYGDVSALLGELATARSRRLSPGDALLLGRYQRRRKGENLAMMAAMDGFRHLFARDELPLRWARNTGMRWLNQISPLKRRIAAEAMGL